MQETSCWKANSLGCNAFRLDVVASQIFEIPRNSPKIRTYNSSRSSKVNDLGANRKLMCNFLVVIINSNFGGISYTVFKILTHLDSVA